MMTPHPLELPEDVWRNIAEQFTRPELAQLISVNRILFNFVLDDRYKEIRWETLDEAMTRSLQRLKVPGNAARVRRLHIRAWFIDYLVRKDRLEPYSGGPARGKWLAPLGSLLGAPPPSPTMTFSTMGAASASDVLKAMTEAVHLMKGVTEYSFEWRDLAPTPETMDFVGAARAAFGSSVRKVCLNAQLLNFDRLLSGFEQLDEIDLTFDYDQESWETPTVLKRTIVPFINQFSETLRGLRIASSSKGDLTPLFEGLGKFEQLRRLSIWLAFSHPKEPDAVTTVLRANAKTLRQLEIIRLPGSTAPSQSAWSQFTTSFIPQASDFAYLQRISISPLPKFDETLTCLRNIGESLIQLTLIDHFLDNAELEQLLRVFSRRTLDAGLEMLHVGLKAPNLRVFELLVKYTPALHTLYLVLREPYLAALQHRTVYHAGLDVNDEAIDTLLTGLEAVTQDWRLRDIGVWDKRFTGATANESPTMREKKVSDVLMRRIPSVRLMRGVPIADLREVN
uniref:F-box domain-containing protein n=1 Tax=Mycena chlorophos TaxID=658473 RepID=A0ABQ0LB98_MYCCL|nr:predicted protein [Mycena chlorophos]